MNGRGVSGLTGRGEEKGPSVNEDEVETRASDRLKHNTYFHHSK